MGDTEGRKDGRTEGQTYEVEVDAVAIVERPHGGSPEKEHVRVGIIVVYGSRIAAVGDSRVEFGRIDDEGLVPALGCVGEWTPQGECQDE